MRHRLHLVGKEKETYISRGIEDYIKRLRHYTTIEINPLKLRGRGKQSSPVDTHDHVLLGQVTSESFVMVLDERGQQLSSQGFAECISSLELRGIKTVDYLIGGPTGHGPEVRQRADLLLSLSKMTFTHDMVRLFLLEQLYRAYTIKAGEQYHK